MNRKIIFRGKGYYDGVWHYGNLIVTDENDIIILNKEDEYDVIPETVGQFTGLLDKNGEEIYEGDIVKDDLEEIYEVCWYDDIAAFMTEDIESEKPFLMSDLDLKDTKIIGNIHDNPELVQ